MKHTEESTHSMHTLGKVEQMRGLNSTKGQKKLDLQMKEELRGGRISLFFIKLFLPSIM